MPLKHWRTNRDSTEIHASKLRIIISFDNNQNVSSWIGFSIFKLKKWQKENQKSIMENFLLYFAHEIWLVFVIGSNGGEIKSKECDKNIIKSEIKGNWRGKWTF